MSPNTIGFVDREGASAWLNEPAAFGAKRPFIRASRSGEAKLYRYFNTYEFAGYSEWRAKLPSFRIKPRTSIGAIAPDLTDAHELIAAEDQCICSSPLVAAGDQRHDVAAVGR